MKKRYTGPDDPQWYKDAIIYQLHVRAFHDANGDGIGDFKGLTEKLDYLKDLGVNTLWLLPFYPSPLKDDGYDTADYLNIHPMYGTMAEFQEFLHEAHARGLRVITELVINHTSDQHAWFQRARRAAPGSRERNYYVWSNSLEKYSEARIIFKDFEASNWSWDPVAKAYFWHRFYAHQPDLNFESADVRKAVFQAMDFWLDMGVDGMRLDAIPYLYEREGTSCENLPETHAFLKSLRKHVDSKYGNRMLLAEANQWPEDAVTYFGDGDECHMAFHFPIMPRMFMSVHMEDRYPIIDILDQTPGIAPGCQWALFLRNHDELTLEMVTDEERDYMYRVYAHDRKARINLGIRRRLAPLVQNNRRKLELLNALLFSLPGTPIIYYGDEIGMGDNIYLGDRNGVRTPMQWSSDRNAGFSRANPQQLYFPVIIDSEYHYEAVNVEGQKNNPHTLYWWMKRLLALSRTFKAFGRGTIEFLTPENRKVLAYVRKYEDETILVVANLSRFVQHAELDLGAFKNRVPVELFGRTDFPPIGDVPYLVMLGPHSFYWFLLDSPRTARQELIPEEELPALDVAGDWTAVFKDRARAALEKALVRYLPACRWFAGKGRKIKSVKIQDTIPLPDTDLEAQFALLEVVFQEGTPQSYSLPIAFTESARAEEIRQEFPQSVISRLHVGEKAGNREGVLHDAIHAPAFCSALLDLVARRRQLKGTRSRILGIPTPSYRALRGEDPTPLSATVVKGEQSNTSFIYGERFVLKLLRRIEPGTNPDLEIGRFLTEKAKYDHAPKVAGFLESRQELGDPQTLGILNSFVPNEGDAWSLTLDELERYFERVRSRQTPESEVPKASLMELADSAPPSGETLEFFGPFLEMARLLGVRTAELHHAMASGEEPDFAPEPFTPFYQRSVFQSMRNQLAQVLPATRKRLKDLPTAVRTDAEAVLGAEGRIKEILEQIYKRKIDASRIRVHGDFHLGQVLYTGKDFVILDFEGEPARTLSERRIKRSPLRDVAGMLRSFHYAAYAALFREEERGETAQEQLPTLERAAMLWHRWTSSAYLKAYLETAGTVGFLPRSSEDKEILLNAFLMDKAIYELGYEINNRPAWVRIPLRGIRDLVGATS